MHKRSSECAAWLGGGSAPAEGPRSFLKLQSSGLGWAGQPPTGPELSAPAGPWEEGSAVCPPRRKIISFPLSRLTYRAEEEDEHLERTLEQNKGKMAKKDEKCVLQ